MHILPDSGGSSSWQWMEKLPKMLDVYVPNTCFTFQAEIHWPFQSKNQTASLPWEGLIPAPPPFPLLSLCLGVIAAWPYQLLLGNWGGGGETSVEMLTSDR